MQRQNFLQFSKKDQKKPIFRIVTFDRMLELIKTRQLALVKPSKWDDPFENVLLTTPIQLSGGRKIRYAAHARMYGQCWSQTKESDAMWRIYSPMKNGVKIRSTIQKIGDALWSSYPTKAASRCFVGKVEYLSRKALDDRFIKEFRASPQWTDSSGIGYARSLLLKRWAFQHENEVRLIYYDRTGEIATERLLVQVDPLVLCDELVFDPRMSTEQYQLRRSVLISWGFPSDRIKRSGLYDPPRFVIDE